MPLKKGTAAGTEREKEALEEALDRPAVGPYPAAVESIETQPAFRAMTTTDDPDAATAAYVTRVDFPERRGVADRRP